MKSNKEKSKVLSSNLFPVVGIGASAGGLEAFKKLIKAIPENSGMAYVLVQHLDPKHESMLPELLQKVTNIPVLEISDEIKVEPNHIYIIPSNKMMVANDGVLLLSPRIIKKNERNLPIDLFFSSLAEVHQSHSIGVVLSGTASDGTKGLKAIKDHGGITIAQSEESAAYDGMPHSAIQAGVVDFILSPEEIPQKLLEVTKIINGNGDGAENLLQQESDMLNQILSLLRIRKGTDFTYYKQPTIHRRILRRMALNKNDDPADYLRFLRENKSEQDALYQDLLIPVTSFFRDPKSFDNLCKTGFPSIIKNKAAGDPIRLWVVGCSTGQEVYSIAICLKEFFGNDRKGEGRVQIFATDISEPAIIKARTAIYGKSELEGITQQRLQEFFIKTNGSYQVNKSIRDMCVFAVHNFLKDPPFGKLDLISCRNVLIYMEPYLQKKALTTFHYALNKNCFLFLGKSETVSSVSDLFGIAYKGDKIFSRKDVPTKHMHTASLRSEQGFANMNGPANDPDKSGRTDPIAIGFQKTADDILLSKYTPAGVVVNVEMDIVHFRGKTGHYLQQLPGKPSHNLLKMAKDGLAFELRNILHKAKKEKVVVTKDNIPLQVNGRSHHISIEAIPLLKTIEPYYLILFHDNNSPDNNQSAISDKKKASGKLKKEDKDLRIQQLEQELAQIREDMRSITEDQEAANEELQSGNEELLSSSEELQSLNEELETGKEELQSTNEELTVVNQEMISLNEQVTAAKDYSENIVANIRESLLVLDKNQRVVTANKTFYKTFRVNEPETEGVLIYDIGNKQWDIPSLRILLEKILLEKSIFNDFEVTHSFSHIGERTMLLNARAINEKSDEKLILLSIEDITEHKRAQEILNKSGDHLQQLVKELPAGVYSCNAQGQVNFYNKAAAKLWGREPEIGKEQWCGSWKIFKPDGTMVPLDNCPMAIAVKEGRSIMGEELIIERPDGTRSNVLVHPQPEFGLSGEVTGAINMVIDITELVKTKKKIQESEYRYHNMIYSSPSMICILKGEDLIIEIANDAILETWGKGKNIIGKSLISVMPEMVEQGFEKLLLSVFKTGEPVYAYETPVTIVRNGKPELMHYTFVYQAQRDTNGEIEGVAILANEVTPQVESKKKLQQSEARYSDMIHSSPSMIAILHGEDFVIDIANDAIIKTWGKGKDVIGKPLLQLIPEIIEQGLGIKLQEVYQTGKSYYAYEMPIKFIRNGKQEISYCTFYYQAIKDLDGAIEGIAILATEVTPQAELNLRIKESEERFRYVVEQTLSPICIFKGEDMILEVANEPVFKIWNVGKEALGKPFLEIVPEMKGQPFMTLLSDVFRNGVTHHGTEWPAYFIRENGEKENLYFNFVFRPYREQDKTISGVFVFANDVTEQVIAKNKNLEDQEIRNRELEEKVQQRTVELSVANEELQKKNKELESFNYISSHDLQEPLRKIQTFTNRILGKEHAVLSDKGKDDFGRILDASGRMQTLIEDLLAYSRTNTADLKFENSNLNEIVEETKKELAESIQEKSAIIETGDLDNASIIPFQFRQMMTNLIANALKFSNPGVPPRITIKSEIEEGSKFENENHELLAGRLSPQKKYCHISMNDNGIGFDPQYKDQIFEIFQRLYGKDEYPGTGIGLAIVKKIVGNHHGIITATSEVNKGATFDIYIPV